MADDSSAEDAATELADGETRITRERRKRQETSAAKLLSSSTGQDAFARRFFEDASFSEHHHHHPHHPHPHHHHFSSSSHPHHRSYNRHCYNHRADASEESAVNSDERKCIASTTASGTVSCNDVDVEHVVENGAAGVRRIEVVVTGNERDDDQRGGNNSGAGVSGTTISGCNRANRDDECDAAAAAVAAIPLVFSSADGARIRSSRAAPAVRLDESGSAAIAEDEDDDREASLSSSSSSSRAVNHREKIAAAAEEEEEQRKMKVLGDKSTTKRDEAGNDAADRSVTSSSSSSSTMMATAERNDGTAASAANDDGIHDVVHASSPLAARHEGSPFKGQVRMAEDTLVGPCRKKRCADRYDSSESSDSGVAVSCGECSSSSTSDITEPGSPCSTSSDEGVAIRGASASPLPSLPKLAPSSQLGTRPQWPWTPPLAATACSTYKRLKGEPEAGALPRSGAADPTSRGPHKTHGKQANGYHHHHHESQGKITEYFKAQIKPQQPKIKKTGSAPSESMSVLVAKSSPEFRQPPTVQRNKGGLAKYLGAVSPPNGCAATTNDWEVRTLTMSPPPTKKPPPVIVPRTSSKMEKKLPKPVPSLPISNDVHQSLANGKISSLRLPSEASASAAKSNSAPAGTGNSGLTGGEPMQLDFKGCILAKPHVNENNNLTNGCNGVLGFLRSEKRQDPLQRLAVPDSEKDKESSVSPADEEDAEEEEEDSSRSSESKPSLSPILSAPTTIRFPAQAPGKERAQAADSGICRWDKCEASFESSSGLLEHLQVAHINTQTGGDNFVCHWQGCKVHGRTSCSRRWLERHVLSHGGNKPFRCIVDGCGSRFSSQTALERHVNGHFNQPETSNSSGRRSCENGGKLVRRNGKRLRYRRQPWSARLFDYFDSGVMEGLQHRLLELAKTRTKGHLAETPGDCMALTSQVIAKRVEPDGKVKILLRWFPQDIEPDEWVLESEVQSIKYVEIRKVAVSYPEEVNVSLYPALGGTAPTLSRVKQRRKPAKNS